MDYFAHLPEGCISEILSFTSAEDTARLSAVSKGFKAAAESDSVWHRFLPPRLTDIISRSASPVVYSNKKELYFALCNSPILLDDGAKLSFSLDRRSGKKCFMIAARQLEIWSGHDDDGCQWESLPDSSTRRERSDGWMEVEMGSFYNDAGDGDVEALFFEIWPFEWKRVLIVQGFEFRPK
nr:F-box protein PP2-B10-like [Ipomoea batatas]